MNHSPALIVRLAVVFTALLSGGVPAAEFPLAMREAEPRLLGARRGWFESLRLAAGAQHTLKFTVDARTPVFVAADVTGSLEWSLHRAGGTAENFAPLAAGRSFPVAGNNAVAAAGEWLLTLRNSSAQERFCTLEVLTATCPDRGTGTSRATAQDLSPSLSSPMRLRRMGAQGKVEAAGGDWWRFTLTQPERLQFSFEPSPGISFTDAAGAALVPENGAQFPAGDYFIHVTGLGSRYAIAVIMGASFAGTLQYADYAAPGTEEPEVAAYLADIGVNDINEANVARMIRYWNPAYIVTGGDNIYTTAELVGVGSPAWKTYLGDYYGEFMMRRADGRNPEQISPVQRFFPAVGNHDTTNTETGGGFIAGYLDYFHSNPGATPRLPVDGGASHNAGESYYRLRRGAVEWVIMDGDHARFSTELMERQKDWVRAALAASDAPWRFIVEGYPPWVSGGLGRGAEFLWLETADAHAIFSGDLHVYERLETNGPAAIICGTGGAALAGFGAISPQSRARHSAFHGAIKIRTNQTGAELYFRDINDGASGGNGGRIMDPFGFGDLAPNVPTLREEWGWGDGSPLVLATFTPSHSSLDLKAEALDEGGGVWRDDDNSAPDHRNARIPVDLNGTFLLRLRPQSPAGGAFEVATLTPWELWQHDRLRHLLPAEAAPDGNPDGDSLPNLVEFATGGDPLAFAAPFSLRHEANPPALVLPYFRATNEAATGVRHIAEISTDLKTWLPVSTDLTAVFGAGFTVTDQIAGDPSAVAGFDARELRLPRQSRPCFLRLRATVE